MRNLLAAAALTLAWAGSAHADRVYTLDFQLFSLGGATHFSINGSITTDGALGALQPDDILSSQFTYYSESWPPNPPVILSSGSPSYGAEGGITFTPGSLSATEINLYFDYGLLPSDIPFPGVEFVNSISIAGLLGYIPEPRGTCGLANNCGELWFLGKHQFAQNRINQIAFNGALLDPVPGPVLGAGLPGLIVAVGGLLGWRRRKRLA